MSSPIEVSQSFVETAKLHATALIKDKIHVNYVFHNLQHTEEVVAAVLSLGQSLNVDERNLRLLEIAAWFHDTGYDQGPKSHEERSAIYAKAFLTSHKMAEADIETIVQLILATRMPHKPQTEFEKLLCDADLSHLGSPSFWQRGSLLRKELVLNGEPMIDDLAWTKTELKFLTKHFYHTEIAKQKYQASKEYHIELLEKQLKRLDPDKAYDSEKKSLEKKVEKEIKEAKKQEKLAGRGVETMYRTTYKTHLTLSAMADNKANLMLSVNAVVISIILSSLVPRLSTQKEWIVPTAMLLISSLSAMVFATLSTKPKVTKGNLTRGDIEQRKGNLLFFGNYFNMPLADYQWGMQVLTQDSDYLYDSMSRDLYFLGVVLAKKYQYLSWCYQVFMYGLIGSVLAFGVATAWKAFL